jgi:hypothetical protein
VPTYPDTLFISGAHGNICSEISNPIKDNVSEVGPRCDPQSEEHAVEKLMHTQTALHLNKDHDNSRQQARCKDNV